ncbi:hypothetical protein [Primorskyibacter sp. S187A]|uniref:hypothetical protein n=1 Tax=Primorskyibacter sp. S187A TaxID=3415130 RepID=UPI003C7BF649
MWPLERLDADVVFIQQPWGMQDLPRRLARHTRVAYVHYGMPVISNDTMQFGLAQFHPWLWRYYAPTRLHADMIQAAQGSKPPHICITGHPKFDTFLTPEPPRRDVEIWPGEATRKRVIVAPHHGLERGSLGLGTFAWSGPTLLDVARKHPEIDFLLRPHPNMALGLMRSRIMTEAQWEHYKAQWSALPNGVVQDGGSYWDVFRSSDALITDSGSFLAEYLPTGAPLIRLEQNCAAPLNAFGQTLAEAFYKVSNSGELETVFENLIVQGNDPLRNTRAKIAAQLTPFERPAAEMIIEDLRSLLKPHG